MENLKIVLIVIAAVAALLIVLMAGNYLKKSKGRAAEKKVAAALKKAGKSRKCKVINNAYLPLYKGSCEVDHILVGDFGVLAVETKGISGTVSGSGKNLTHKIGKQVHTLYNPQLQNKTHMDNIQYHLQKAGMKNVPVHGVVVFTADDVVLESDIGIYLRNLPDFIVRLRSCGCDTRKVYDVLDDVRIRNPFKKLWHDFTVGLKK